MSYLSNSNFCDKIEILVPRQIPQEIIQLEEEERSGRIEAPIDPIWLGKWYRVQSELTKNWGQIKLGSLRSSAKSSINETVSNISQKANQLIDSLKGKANVLVESAKEKVGISGDIKFQEEKERLRRMNQKVDPMIGAQKHKVENELLQTVKASN